MARQPIWPDRHRQVGKEADHTAAEEVSINGAEPEFDTMAGALWADVKNVGKTLLIAAGVCIVGLAGIGIAASIEADDSEPDVGVQDIGPPALATVSEAPSLVLLSEGLVGTWVQAERGGEDGRTNCADAEAMTTLNGGSTDAVQYFRNGVVEYTLWYDTMFESRGEPQVKSAYNTGNWALDANQLNLSWKGGNTGMFGSDLGAGDAHVIIELDDNVMKQSSDEGTTRFVRCR